MDPYLTVANFAPCDSPTGGHTHMVHTYCQSIGLEWAKDGANSPVMAVTLKLCNMLLVGKKR